MATRERTNQGFAAEDQEEKKDVEAQQECPQTIADDGLDKRSEGRLDSRDDLDTGTESKSSLRASIASYRGGLCSAALTAFLFSVKNIFVHYLTVTVDPFQSVAMVMLVTLFCSLAAVALKRISPPKTAQQYRWLLAGALPFSLTFSAIAVSVTFIDVADVITIGYCSLVFVGVLGWVILRERLYLFDFVFAIISLSGVVCIARPQFIFGTPTGGADEGAGGSRDLIIGVGSAMVLAFCSALTFVMMKKQSLLGIHMFTAVLCVGLGGLVINSIICTALLQWRVPSWDEWLFSLGAGVSFFAAAATMVLSLSLEPPTLVNIVLTLEIAFTFLLQFVFLRVTPHWTSYIGAGLVIIACIGIGLKKRREE